MKKKLVVLIAICVVLILLSFNWGIITYGIEQGRGQINVMTNTVPIVEMLSNPTTSDTIKAKLKLVAEIKKFAQDSLGLVETKNYTTFYDQGGKPILWMVTACPKYELKEYKWSYPILGDLGYKGFFDKSKADQLAEKMQLQGFDVDVDEVNAWSTLGWFKDPVLSSMLKKSEGELARLLIHELTHTTIYIADDADFNENLATYVGDNGARRYIVAKYGYDSKELVTYNDRLNDIELLSEHLVRGAKQFEKLYAQMNELEVDQKERLKQQQITQILNNIDTIKFSSENRFKSIRNEMKPTNAFFISYLMYRGSQSELDSIFKTECEGSFLKLIERFED